MTDELKKAATDDSYDLVKHMVNNRLVHGQAISSAVPELTQMLSRAVRTNDEANTRAVSQILKDVDGQTMSSAVPELMQILSHAVQNNEANTYAVSQILKDKNLTDELKKAATNDLYDLVKHMVSTSF